jgi:hypothetical protein
MLAWSWWERRRAARRAGRSRPEVAASPAGTEQERIAGKSAKTA